MTEKSIYDLFSTDKQMERDGLWLDYGDYGRIRVARAGGSNRRYVKAMEAVYRKNRKLIDLGAMPEDGADDLLAQVFAEHVVVGWEGIKGRDGAPIPFSAEACRQLFRDMPALFADVREKSADFANFREAEMEGDRKN